MKELATPLYKRKVEHARKPTNTNTHLGWSGLTPRDFWENCFKKPFPARVTQA